MNKKTTKNSNRKSKKTKNRQENAIIVGIFLLFILVVAYLFYFMSIKPSNENAVAIVNGNKITRGELDWWYGASVLPEARAVITKQDFLIVSLIPQEILMQKAKKEGIAVTKDEVEKLIGRPIINEEMLALGKTLRAKTNEKAKIECELEAKLAKIELEKQHQLKELDETMFEANQKARPREIMKRLVLGLFALILITFVAEMFGVKGGLITLGLFAVLFYAFKN